MTGWWEAATMGIIPARAGFTLAGSDPGDRPEDHPRSRGVYTAPRSRGGSGPGSSPLARGLLAAVLVLAVGVGIIPARAGFTPWSPRTRGATRDHPRSRGVYRSRPRDSLSRSGSSPLARGLRFPSAGTNRNDWIIPARAGFTWTPASSPTTTPDHPRSRGVYAACSWTSPTPPGSSPLARGLPSASISMACARRIIPARAGFTRRP